MAEKLSLTATVKVNLTKLDDAGNIISIDEHIVELPKEEAEKLWHLQQQA